MIAFPIAERLDARIGILWLERHRHPHGLTCPPWANLPAGNTRLDTDEWQSYRGSHPAHATVRHGAHAWARDDDGDGRREVHCNSGEGAGAALRTSRRAFRGVHKLYLHLDVATYEAMVNAKRVTPKLIRRMCIISPTMHAGYT
jgi:transposase